MKTSTRLLFVLLLSIAFFCVEIAVGFKTASLALIADAFHYLSDIVAVAIALLAATVQERKYHPTGYTYALHRAELVGALFNGVLLLGLALSVFLQSLERFINIQTIDDPLLVIIVGAVGLALNIISAGIIGHDHNHGHNHGHKNDSGATAPDLEDFVPQGSSHNQPIFLATPDNALTNAHISHNHARPASPIASPKNFGLSAVLLHVFGDAINNIGVIAAGFIILKSESPYKFYADPAISMFISFVIFGSAIPLTLKTSRILLEASPKHIDLDNITEDLLTIPHVKSVHDLHVWQLSQDVTLATIHVQTSPELTMQQWSHVDLVLRECFAGYGVNHVTVAPEATAPTAGSANVTCVELHGCSGPKDAA